jgi:lipopolysaccharide transport system ATP-binding protein
MSSEKTAISVRGLGKSYHIAHKQQHSTMAEAMLHRLKNPFARQNSEEMWALKDISFDIAQGDIVGLLGRNGAGKSTLLKVLSRITEPTTGNARLAGRVGSLIEVGTGFQPELTGRENIYLNGAILGMRRREITKRFDEIVDFSGVERFLDTPVKHYSSGMYVRLAFAVAAHLDTDILFVDEVLSVGDAEFQKKSLGKMGDVAHSGRTIIFVSHNVSAIESLCQRGIFFQSGRLIHEGPIAETLSVYHNAIGGSVSKGPAGPVLITDRQYLKSIDIIDDIGDSTRIVPVGTDLTVKFRMDCGNRLDKPMFFLFVDNLAGQKMLCVALPKTGRVVSSLAGTTDVTCVIQNLPLPPGDYFVRLKVMRFGEELEQTDRAINFTVTDADTFGDGWGAHGGVCVAAARWSTTRIDQASEVVL